MEATLSSAEVVPALMLSMAVLVTVKLSLRNHGHNTCAPSGGSGDVCGRPRNTALACQSPRVCKPVEKRCGAITASIADEPSLSVAVNFHQ
jgi:hypothetical protein